jgi:hypothetical protein
VSLGCWKEEQWSDGAELCDDDLYTYDHAGILHSGGVDGLGNGYRLLREALIMIPMD